MKTWKRTRAKAKAERRETCNRKVESSIKKETIDRPSPKLYMKEKNKNKSCKIFLTDKK